MGLDIQPSLENLQPRSSMASSESPLTFDFADSSVFSPARDEWAKGGVGGYPTVAGGVVTPVDDNEVILARKHERCSDIEIVKRMTTDAALNGVAGWSVIARSSDDFSNLLMARWNAADGGILEIHKRVSGTFTRIAFGASSSAPATSGTTYWLRARFIGNMVTVEWWTSNPDVGGSPVASLSHTLSAGDAALLGAGVSGRYGFRTSGVERHALDHAVFRPLVNPRQRDVQVFTSSGTWTKPAGASADPNATVRVIAVSGGGGGGGGRRVSSGTNASGGGGGGGGPSVDYTYPAHLTQTGAVTVGAGGAAGAAATTDNTNGGNGGNGGTTNAAILSTGQLVRAGFWGSGGIGGSTGTANGGGGGAGYPENSSSGGSCSAGNTGNAGGASVVGGAGGGAGGGVNVTPTPFNGGNGGYHFITQLAASGGVAPGGAGQDPSSVSPSLGMPLITVGGTTYRWGYGGGGGAGSHTGAGGAGAPGQNYGGGGGGGGASLNGNNSGAGGAGAPGVCIIVTEWGG